MASGRPVVGVGNPSCRGVILLSVAPGFSSERATSCSASGTPLAVRVYIRPSTLVPYAGGGQPAALQIRALPAAALNEHPCAVHTTQWILTCCSTARGARPAIDYLCITA